MHILQHQSMSVFDQSYHETTSAAGCFGFQQSPSPPLFASPHANSNSSNNNDKQILTGEDQQKKQQIDTLLSEAFKTLTFEELQVQQEELHGVADELAEETSLIENSLRDLEFYLNQTKAGRVYETAERLDPSYVHSRPFRIMFLRADRYNAKAAADRILRFFDEKEKLFGVEKLTKHITSDDLDQDDIAVIKSGSMQWVGKDRSNRPVMLALPGLREYNKKLISELRARYFVMMEGVKSPEAQLRGTVMLTYMIGEFKDRSKGHGFIEHSRLAISLPLFYGAFHIACDDIKQHLLGSAVIATTMRADLRARFRLHLGTHLECQYRLSSYGIPRALLPLTPETNAVDMKLHLRWCQSHMSNIENNMAPMLPQKHSSSSGSIITEPSPNDVVSDGSLKSDNIGNSRLRVLVKESAEAHRSGSADEKKLIVDRIIGEIHDTGGRFLHKEKGSQTWIELSVPKVRQKIAQRFRNQNRKRESASQQAREGTLIADLPRPTDVIFGRAHHPNRGTAFLHHLIKVRSDEYETANRSAKVVVVDGIIERIQSEGGRFLTPSTADIGRFVELSSIDSIRDRISTYFRNSRRKWN